MTSNNIAQVLVATSDLHNTLNKPTENFIGNFVAYHVLKTFYMQSGNVLDYFHII